MKKWLFISVLALILVGSGVYWAEFRYKYSCQGEDQCYPCTRWMSCVSEEFYLRNAIKCRLGGEENFSRIVCSCSSKNSCEVKEIKPESTLKVDAWVPPD